jgi:hypothetical protein
MPAVLCDTLPETFPQTADTSSPLVVRLYDAVDAIEAEQPREALALLRSILAEAHPKGRPVERVVRAFAVGLKARLTGDRSGIGNLYHVGCDPGRMLAAFQVLVQSTPFIRFGYAAANRALAHVLRGASRLHLMDIGIGSGAQWGFFLDALASGYRVPRSIRLTGIDVPAPGDDPSLRLRHVGRSLTERAAHLGLPLEFEPVAGLVEDLDLRTLRRHPDEALAVNAAFALHHLPSGDGGDPGRDRDAVLRRLRELRPRVLTLVEPDVEHNALPLLPRAIESLLHYLMVFDALEARLPRNPVERAILENEFFGREILNILAGEDTERVERHERHRSWHDRLCRQGFEPIDLRGFAGELEYELELSPPFAVTVDRGMLVLTWRGYPVIAASAWQPRR